MCAVAHTCVCVWIRPIYTTWGSRLGGRMTLYFAARTNTKPMMVADNYLFSRHPTHRRNVYGNADGRSGEAHVSLRCPFQPKWKCYCSRIILSIKPYYLMSNQFLFVHSFFVSSSWRNCLKVAMRCNICSPERERERESLIRCHIHVHGTF